MYIPPHFRQDDPVELRALIHGARLATLVSVADGVPFVSHVPLMLDESASPHGTLLGHLSRANPQWRTLAAGDALVIFMGPDAYVSPNRYASKAEHGKVVPTWNYVAVHAYGRPRLIEAPAELRALVDRLTALHEADEPVPWSSTDAPPAYVEAQLAGIVGFAIPIDRIEGKWKLSQNRPDADMAGVIDGLSASRSEADRATAAAMSAALAAKNARQAR